MKMMRKNWKDRKGVSPVIATILMVAITVVLAAVLYVMVMGFGGDDQTSITGTFTGSEKLGDTAMKVRFGALSPSVDGSKISLRVDVTGPSPFIADSATFKWGENKWTTTDLMTAGPLQGEASIAFEDLAEDDKISSGDYITITHAANVEGTDDVTYTITVSMLNAASGALIDSIEYSWVVDKAGT